MPKANTAAAPAPKKLAKQSNSRWRSVFTLFCVVFFLTTALLDGGYFVELFVFQVEAIIAEVRNWSDMTYAESHLGVLLTSFYPVPPVRFRSLNIFFHIDPQIMLVKAPIISNLRKLQLQ